MCLNRSTTGLNIQLPFKRCYSYSILHNKLLLFQCTCQTSISNCFRVTSIGHLHIDDCSNKKQIVNLCIASPKYLLHTTNVIDVNLNVSLYKNHAVGETWYENKTIQFWKFNMTICTIKIKKKRPDLPFTLVKRVIMYWKAPKINISVDNSVKTFY